MKINLWGINYSPEQTGIAVYNALMCEYLQDAGHSVSVTTAFPYYPSWTSTDHALARTDVINGIAVHRNWLYVPTRLNATRRILHELSFVVTSSWRQLLQPAADVYLVVSPPLLLGFAAWLVCAIKCRPFVLHVQDLQPDAAVNLGMLKKGLLVRLAYALERLAYEKAARVTVISDEMKQALIAKGVPQDKVHVVANVVNVPNRHDLPARNQWKSKFGFAPTDMVISYCGNLGVKQGIELVVDAAEHLAADSSIKVIICGDGADRQRISDMVKSRRLSNVTLLGLQSPEDYSALLIDSEFCLVTQKPGTGASFLPSKLLNILALGRPVISNADRNSALHTAIATGQFGLHCENTGASLAQAIMGGLSDCDGATQMSECGRAYVSQFDAKTVYRELLTILCCVGEAAMVDWLGVP